MDITTTDEIWLEVIESSNNFKQKITNTEELELPSLYGEGEEETGGFWYDTIDSLVNLQQSQPNNLELKNEWQDLLESVGLEDLKEQPLLDCCKFEE